MRILCFQHVEFETPGAIADWARERECELTCVDVPRLEAFPERSTFDLLLLMGGPMGVYEEEANPWLAREKTYIKAAIDEGKHVLGICLGAQLIAAALGSRVYAGGRKEIGWFPIRLTSEGRCSGLFNNLESDFCPLHWHGDTFDLPQGSTLLASSSAYANQAFIYKEKVMALQFHLEIRPQDAASMIGFCGAELAPDTYVQSGTAIMAASTRFSKSNVVLYNCLDRWLGGQIRSGE